MSYGLTAAGLNKGKAAIEFDLPAQADKAASHMNGGQLDGQYLKVKVGLVGPSMACLGLDPSLTPDLRHGHSDRPAFSTSPLLPLALAGSPTTVSDVLALTIPSPWLLPPSFAVA